jgi:mycoredoxin
MIGMLKQSQVDYDYINIFDDSAARARVREINNGYESVPTFEFPDGTTLTEPSAGQLKRKLQMMGYHVPLRAQIVGNAVKIFVAVMVGWAVLSALGIL